jgi:hypothetical protein
MKYAFSKLKITSNSHTWGKMKITLTLGDIKFLSVHENLCKIHIKINVNVKESTLLKYNKSETCTERIRN